MSAAEGTKALYLLTIDCDEFVVELTDDEAARMEEIVEYKIADSTIATFEKAEPVEIPTAGLLQRLRALANTDDEFSALQQLKEFCWSRVEAPIPTEGGDAA